MASYEYPQSSATKGRPVQPAPRLHEERLRFSILIISNMVLPPYKGGIFRGAFGYALRRVVCAVPKGECKACILKDKCLYVNIFEPSFPNDLDYARKYRHAPPPFILRPPLTNRQSFHPGETLEFEMILMGPSLDALPYIIYSLVEMGPRGLGRERGKFELLKAELLRGDEILPVYNGETQTLEQITFHNDHLLYPAGEDIYSITLNLITPMRMKAKGRLMTEFSFPLFVERLAERIILLTACYGNGAIPELEDLLDRSKEIEVSQNNTYWYDWGRYSGRQKDYMKLGGLRGDVTLKGDLAPFMPILRTGETVHVGQGAVFGLGWYGIAKV